MKTRTIGTERSAGAAPSTCRKADDHTRFTSDAFIPWSSTTSSETRMKMKPGE